MDDETTAAFEAAQQRIEDLQAKLDAALEGNKTWTEAQIATFQSTLVELRTELNTISGQSATTQELREQLTLMQREVSELKAAQTILPTPSAPAIPNPSPAPVPAPEPAKVAGPKAAKTNNQVTGKKYL